MSVNKMILVARVGKDPKVTTTTSGSTIVNFSVATDESYKDKVGTKIDKTEWHNVVAFGKLAEFCAKWVKKGKEYYIEGRIQTRSYGEENAKKYITEVVADQVRFVGDQVRESNNAEYPTEAEQEVF